MAKNPHYIYDLPFQPRRELCRILDADRRWEELGGIYMQIDVTTLTLIGQAIHREKSPTWELLSKWSEKNGTIKLLFSYLAKMDHQRAMMVLLPYVDKKYHKLVRMESGDSTAFGKSFESGPSNRPMPPSFTSALQSAATCMVSEESNVLTQRYGHDTLQPIPSHSTKDLINMNRTQNTLSADTKLNSLNQHQQSRLNNLPLNLASNVRNVRDDAANCEESNTDNCASEKMRSVLKMAQNGHVALPEKTKNEKPVSNKLEERICADLKSLEKSLPDIMKISYKEILKATDDFMQSRVLGRGGFGAVYKGEWKDTSVAIKRLMPREGGGDSVSHRLVSLKQSVNELTILKCCRFDHILPLYGVSLDGPEPCLVYQLMVNGSLEDRLLCRNNTPPLTWSQRSNIAEQTAKGLNYLHTTLGKPLVHGDIKSANILLDANMEAKIGDFGLTREGPDPDNTHVKVSKLHGTECYLPPEYLRHRQLSPQVDVYSYGIVLLEMATGLRPYDSRRDEKLLVFFVSDCGSSGRLDSIRDTKAGEENMMWFGELLKIGQECSKKDKHKRPTMQRVLELFQQIKEELLMVDKIRRLSNDRGSVADTSKLKQLTPYELQKFYDVYKEKYGTNTGGACASAAGCSFPPATSAPNDASIPVPILLSLAESEHNSRASADPRCVAVSPSTSAQPREQGTIKAMNIGCAVSNSCDQANATTSSDENSSDNRAPLPMLTVLQLQVSEISESSCNCEPSKTDTSASDISKDFSSIGYSIDSTTS